MPVEEVGDRRHRVKLEALVGVELQLHSASPSSSRRPSIRLTSRSKSLSNAAVLPHPELLVLLLGKPPRHLGGDLPGVGQHLVLVEVQEGVQPSDPLGHPHGDLPRGLVFGVVEVHRDDPLQLLDLALDQVVLGHAHVGLEDLAVRCVLPGRQAHRGLRGVGALGDDLGRRLAGHGPVQLVLHGLEEGLGDLGLRVVVDAALLVDVGDLQVEAALAGPDLADALEQLVEVVLAEPPVELQPLVVEHEPLDDELLEGLGGPDAELGGPGAVDPIADGDDGVEVVVVDLAAHVTSAFTLNCQDSFDSCLPLQLTGVEDLLQMV